MTEADEKRVREIVREELLGMIKDGEDLLAMKKDPTGMARKALGGLAGLIRDRQNAEDDQK